MKFMKSMLLSLIVVALSVMAFAQGSATGDLHVAVKDPAGKMVSNATVTVIDQTKGVARSTTQNSDGEYRFVALAPGRYTVTIAAGGFSKAVYEDQIITVGQVADLPVNLQVSGGETVVNVSSEADLVETSRTSSTDTIEQRRIDNLPINGRSCATTHPTWVPLPPRAST
jgi:sarcosine oxidase gamma subunit